MTNLQTVVRLIGALALAAAGLAFAADSGKDLAALEAADQAWVKAVNAGNAQAAADLYDEKAALLPPNAPAANGRAAIKAFLAGEIAEMAKAGVSFSLGAKPAGGVSGDMGWQSGSYAVKDKSGKVLETGKYLSVSVKKGGKWLYVRDIYNADAAPPAPAPTTSATPPRK